MKSLDFLRRLCQRVCVVGHPEADLRTCRRSRLGLGLDKVVGTNGMNRTCVCSVLQFVASDGFGNKSGKSL